MISAVSEMLNSPLGGRASRRPIQQHCAFRRPGPDPVGAFGGVGGVRGQVEDQEAGSDAAAAASARLECSRWRVVP